ncbi:MAG: YcaO-like family protein [Dermatophilaceae bacterium]
MSAPAGSTTGRLRLAPGHFLYPGSDGRWRHAAPDDRFVRLGAPSRLVDQARRFLVDDVGELSATGEVAALLEELRQRGVSTSETTAGARAAAIAMASEGPEIDRPASATARATVAIDILGADSGEHPVATRLATLLAPHARIVSGNTPERAHSGDGTRPDVVVSCAGWLPDAHWRDLDRALVGQGCAWHRCHVDGDGIRVGPLVVPGRTASYADARARRLAASPSPGELADLWAYLDDDIALPPVSWPETATAAAAVLAADILAYLQGHPPPEAHREVVLRGGEVVRHPVLPLPAVVGDLPPVRLPHSALVDSRYGVVTSVRREPDTAGVPAAFVDFTADLARTTAFASWTADAITGGASLGDPDRARAAAIGEAVERYCGNAVPEQMRAASAAELAHRGEAAVDPLHLALYSPRQYATGGFPFVPFTHDLVTSWVPGRELAARDRGHDAPVAWVPAALTYLNVNRSLASPPITCQAFAGIAAGTTVADAERAALEEVIERDAVTIWWTSGAEAAPLDMSGHPLLADVLADRGAADLRVTFLDIPCAVGVPVVGAFVTDTRHDVVGFGSACRPTRSAAAAKALTEALVIVTTGRALADPDGDFWTGVCEGRITDHPYRAFRADRRYRMEFRADLRDLTVLDVAVQLHLDPAMGEELRRLREPAGTAGPDPEPVPSDPRQWYLDALVGSGLRAYAVDLTTTDVALTGWHAVRVVVPGLLQNAPAAFPTLGATRLYTEPPARGWVADPLTEDDLVLSPLPFA